MDIKRIHKRYNHLVYIIIDRIFYSKKKITNKEIENYVDDVMNDYGCFSENDFEHIQKYLDLCVKTALRDYLK